MSSSRRRSPAVTRTEPGSGARRGDWSRQIAARSRKPSRRSSPTPSRRAPARSVVVRARTRRRPAPAPGREPRPAAGDGCSRASSLRGWPAAGKNWGMGLARARSIAPRRGGAVESRAERRQRRRDPDGPGGEPRESPHRRRRPRDPQRARGVDQGPRVRAAVRRDVQGSGKSPRGIRSRLLIVDIHLPDGDGIEILRAAREKDPEREGIVITGQGSIDNAIEALRAGAFDYLLKPLRPGAARGRVQAPGGPPASGDGSRDAAGRAAGDRAPRGSRGPLRADDEDLRDHPARRALQRPRSHHRGLRHRQGGRRADDPPALAARPGSPSSPSTAARSRRP